MTILIRNKVIPEGRAIKLAREPHDGRVKHLVNTWSDATLKHCFDGRKEFRKAVRRNREALQSRGKKFVIRKVYEDFFICKNLRFSTKASGREETLYFKDAQHTGRLRQQHSKGPLVTIDHHRRICLFFSQERLNALNRRHEKASTFCRVGLEPSDGTRLIEFEWDGVRVNKCHASEGKVSTSRTNVKRRINHALQNILGNSSS